MLTTLTSESFRFLYLILLLYGEKGKRISTYFDNLHLNFNELIRVLKTYQRHTNDWKYPFLLKFI